MKRFFKLRSLVSIFLILSMLLTLLCACKEKDEKDKSKDEDDPDDSEEEIADSYISSLLGGLRSAKIDFSFDIFIDEDYEYGTYCDIDADASFVFSINKKGGIDAKLDLKGEGTTEKGKEPSVIDATMLYLVDGKLYLYDTDLNAYIVEESISHDDIKEFEDTLKSAIEENLMGVDMDEISEYLVTALSEILKVNANGISFDLDIMPVYSAVSSYVNELDLETDSLGDIMNDIYALIGVEGTYEDAFNAAEQIYGLTVNEFIDLIDSSLVADSGMTLNDLYTALVTNKELLDAIKSIPDESGEIAQMMATLSSMSLDDIIESLAIGDVTIYELIASGLTDENGNILTCEEFFDQINELYSMSLADLEVMTNSSFFTDIKEFFSSFELKELDFAFDAKISRSFALESITLEGNVAYDLYNSKYDIYVKTSISDFSKESLDISLPKGIETLEIEAFLAA